MTGLDGATKKHGTKKGGKLPSGTLINDPQVLREHIDALGIVGAKITDLNGMAEFFYEEGPEFNGVRKPDKNKIAAMAGEPMYFSVSMDRYFYARAGIVTNKGVFEICWPENDRNVCLSKHRKTYRSWYCEKNLGELWDIRKIFSCIHGREIVDFIIDAGGKDNKPSGIEHVRFVLDNGQMLKIGIEYGRFFCISLLEKDGKPARVPEGSPRRYLMDKYAFFKNRKTDKIWMVSMGDVLGPWLFSFDKKRIYNFYSDYPWNMKPEEVEIFKKWNPTMAELGAYSEEEKRPPEEPFDIYEEEP